MKFHSKLDATERKLRSFVNAKCKPRPCCINLSNNNNNKACTCVSYFVRVWNQKVI